MFPWFRPKCPVEPELKAWVERRMAWLVGQFGAERLQHGKVILPTEEFFPDPYDESNADVRALLDRTCRYMGIDANSVDLELYSESRHIGDHLQIVRPEGGTAGLYYNEENRTKVALETSRLRDPVAVIATFAHELCHVHLLGGGRITNDVVDHEPLTDLATVYFGMGVFTANAMLRSWSVRHNDWEGWGIARQGYLAADAIGYSLALYTWLRRESWPAWAGQLRLDVRSVFKKAIGYFEHANEALDLREEMFSATETPYSAELMARLGVRRGEVAAIDKERDSEEQHDEGGGEEGGDEEDEQGNSDPADDAFTQATLCMRDGHWSEAVCLLSEVLNHDHDDAEAYQQRALAYLELGQPNEALYDAQHAVHCAPEDSESYQVRGWAHLALRKFDEAIADFTHYVDKEDSSRSNPVHFAKVYYGLGVAYAEQGNLADGLASVSCAIEYWPQSPTLYAARALIYSRLANDEKAQCDREEASRRTQEAGRALQGLIVRCFVRGWPESN